MFARACAFVCVCDCVCVYRVCVRGDNLSIRSMTPSDLTYHFVWGIDVKKKEMFTRSHSYTHKQNTHRSSRA